MIVVKNIVEESIARSAVLKIDNRAAIGGVDNGVVHNEVVRRSAAAVIAEQRNAGRVIVVKQVVAEDRILHAVGVDGSAAAIAVVVNNVVFDDGARDDAV